MARGIVVACMLSATAVALFYAVENKRGRDAWAKAEAEAREAGYSLSLEDVLPQPVPVEQTLVAAPELREMFASASRAEAERDVRWFWEVSPARLLLPPDINGTRKDLSELNWVRNPEITPSLDDWRAFIGARDLSAHLAAGSQELAALAAAARRARAIGYRDHLEEIPRIRWGVFGLWHAGELLTLRARVRIEAGDVVGSAEDIVTVYRLAGIFSTDDKILGGWFFRWGAQAVREGLAAGIWREAELAQIEEAAAALRPYAEGLRVSRVGQLLNLARLLKRAEPGGGESGEDPYLDSLIEWMPFEFFPSDWWPLSARGQFFQGSPETGSEANRAILDWLGPKRVLAAMPRGWWLQVAASVLRADRATMEKLSSPARGKGVEPGILLSSNELTGPWSPYWKMARGFSEPPYAFQNVFFAQVRLDLARTAITLERWRLRHGSYPAGLEELETEGFIVPRDLMSGGPFCYVRTEADRFSLYSVGQNGTDDGGSVNAKAGGVLAKDWVW